MKLNELLQHKSLTPLPWRIGDKIEGLNLHHILSAGGHFRVALEVGTMDATLIRHSVAVLPELVEASKVLFGMRKGSGMPINAEWAALGEALTKAENIN